MKLCGFEAGLDRPLFLIAGPCVVESLELQVETAGRLKEITSRLGVPFKVVDIKPARFRVEVAKRIAAFNEQAGLPGDWPVPPAERARIRTEVARELFAVLRAFDAKGVKLIWVERPPDTPDWEGVNDRLQRAAAH